MARQSKRASQMGATRLKRVSTTKSRKTMNYCDYKDQQRDTCQVIDRLESFNSQNDKVGRSTCQRQIQKTLHSHGFEYCMGALVVSNIFVMVIEIDASAAQEEESTSVPWTDVFGWVVLAVFTVELLLRLYAFRKHFWLDAWNVFDFIIVTIDIVAFFMTLLLEKVFSVTWLRIFRLAKLARISKILRVFPELRLLLASLLSALSAIAWGTILLFLVLLAWAMAAVLFIHPLNKHIDYGAYGSIERCERCPRAYSSVMHSLLTFWQAICAGDSWGKTSIPLIEHHPVTACFFIPMFLSVGMAVVSLILGMVVSVAQETKNEIKEVERAEATASKFERQSNLLRLCKEMDTDGSGEISQDELYTAFEVPGEFRDSMEALGITRDDFDVVWALLDRENSGSVCYKRLVSRLYGMKTSDSQFTLAYLKYHVTYIRDVVTQIEEGILYTENEEEKIEKELLAVEQKEDQFFRHQEELMKQLQEQMLKSSTKEQKIERELLAVEKKEDQFFQHQEELLRQLQDKLETRKSIRKSTRKSTMEPSLKKQVSIVVCEASEKELTAPAREHKDHGDSGLVSENKEMHAPLGQRSDTARGEEPQIEHPKQGTFNELLDHSSNTTARLIGERSLLEKVSHDIGSLRLEIKDILKDTLTRSLNEFMVNFQDALELASEAPLLPTMEQDATTKGTHMDLLVVPKRVSPVSPCSLFPSCN